MYDITVKQPYKPQKAQDKKCCHAIAKLLRNVEKYLKRNIIKSGFIFFQQKLFVF